MRGGMTLTLGLATVGLLAGCGGGGRAIRSGEMGPGGVERASYDHVFFVGIPQTAQLSEEEHLQSIRRNIAGLATTSWESARDNLFRSGRRAMIELIDSLDRAEKTGVPSRSLPGIGLQEERSWSLGYVAYSVLVDFVNNYTNYSGVNLPSHNRNAWVDWWERNSRDLVVYSVERTAPEYVQRQIEDERLALTARFDASRPRAERERRGRAERDAAPAPTRVETPTGEAEAGEEDDVVDEPAVEREPPREVAPPPAETIEQAQDEPAEPSRRTRRRR